MDEMFDFEPYPMGADLRDPGLYPDFHLFIANLLMGYLACAPGRINALLSGYDLVARTGLPRVLRNIAHSRATFLDSGAISVLMAVMRGTMSPTAVHEYVQRTDELVVVAHQLHEAGSPPGVIASMDLPAYRQMLAPAGLTVESAERITIDNARDMLTKHLPPGWRPVFTSQGLSIAEHQRCLGLYDELGVLDLVRQGKAWLAVGGMAFEDHAERVWRVHQAIREVVGPVGHIHALGVGRVDVLAPMVVQGWINSADSSSPAQEVKYNRGAYQMRPNVPRPEFLVNALHAAAGLYLEADLGQAIARYRAVGAHHQQQEMFDAL
jgi:hypothetical protein